MPKISVIVPVYKVEPYLRRCVDSILAQTFIDFDLILVDDGSPDNCGAICDEYALQDSRIHVIHQENGGLSAARNAGIDWAFAHSDSQWLMFVDSDDWVHPKIIEKLYYAVQQYHVPLSFCKYESREDVGSFELEIESSMVLLDSEQAYVNEYYSVMSAWMKCYDKNLFRNIRYPVGKLNEDAFVTYRLLFEAKQVVMVDSVLYYYLNNPQSITRSPWMPRKLDEIEGHEQQLSFLKNSPYKRAYQRQIRSYKDRLREQIRLIQDTKWKRSKYERLLRGKLAKLLIAHNKSIRFKGNEHIYELAFPKTIYLYWTVLAQIKKIQKRIKPLD